MISTKALLLVAALLLAPLRPGAEMVVCKKVDDRELKLLIEKPADWKATDHRPAIVFAFGGGWMGGTPERCRQRSEYLATR